MGTEDFAAVEGGEGEGGEESMFADEDPSGGVGVGATGDGSGQEESMFADEDDAGAAAAPVAAKSKFRRAQKAGGSCDCARAREDKVSCP